MSKAVNDKGLDEDILSGISNIIIKWNKDYPSSIYGLEITHKPRRFKCMFKDKELAQVFINLVKKKLKLDLIETRFGFIIFNTASAEVREPFCVLTKGHIGWIDDEAENNNGADK